MLNIRNLSAVLIFVSAILGMKTDAASAQTPNIAFEDGGVKDLNTGLVWSGSFRDELGISFLTWDEATTAADMFQVQGVDSTTGESRTFDDWRLPTVSELQQAIDNGTLGFLLEASPVGTGDGAVLLWSSQRRGNSATAVWICLDEDDGLVEFCDWNGDIVFSGEPFLTLRRSLMPGYFVRDSVPTDDGKGNGNGKGPKK